jgi:5-methylcytosine-specific restriction endonuclease McrA
MYVETTRCVVLNASYEPLSVISAKRALILIFEGKAVVVEEHPEYVVRSPSITMKIPVMVALKEYVKARRVFHSPAALTQRNLFVRDNHTCQYCARHKSELRTSEVLTRDHIIPESRGGKNTWENLVTACSTCNNKKAAHHLEDTGMRLLKKPVTPTLFELWMRHARNKELFASFIS